LLIGCAGSRMHAYPFRMSRDADLDSAVAAAQQGNEAAFSRVYRAVQPGLLRYLSALVGADAEDVASETWAQACRDLDTFRGDGDGFRGWVATIGRHRALDHLRASGRRPVAPAPVDHLVATLAADTADLAFESLSTAAAIALICSLPRDQAEAVLLRAVLGLDAKSAGRVLGKRPGAVRTAAYRGLKTLGLRLTADGGTPARPARLEQV
jgi:RNA polymerase sigma-70 factor, ECF subfamily